MTKDANECPYCDHGAIAMEPNSTGPKARCPDCGGTGEIRPISMRTKPPEEIYLNISDESEMPHFNEIDWGEVTWSADEAALTQALLYISYDALSKWSDEMKALEKRNEKLETLIKELAESAEYWSEYDVPLGIVDRIKEAVDSDKESEDEE